MYLITKIVDKTSNLYFSSSVSVFQVNISDAEFIIVTLESQAINCIFLSFLKKETAFFTVRNMSRHSYVIFSCRNTLCKCEDVISFLKIIVTVLFFSRWIVFYMHGTIP